MIDKESDVLLCCYFKFLEEKCKDKQNRYLLAISAYIAQMDDDRVLTPHEIASVWLMYSDASKDLAFLENVSDLASSLIYVLQENNISGVIENVILQSEDFKKEKEAFESEMLESQNMHKQESHVVNNPISYKKRLNFNDNWAQHLSLKNKIYYQFLEHYFLKNYKVEVHWNHFLEFSGNNADKKFICLKDLVEYQLRNRSSNLENFTGLFALLKEKDALNDKLKKDFALLVIPAIKSLKNAKKKAELIDYFCNAIDQEKIINDFRNLIHSLQNKDILSIKQSNNILNEFSFYIHAVKNQAPLLRIDEECDGNNLLHTLIEYAMQVDLSGDNIEKGLRKIKLIEKLISVICYELEDESFQQVLQSKNSKGQTPSEFFFYLATESNLTLGKTCTQFNQNGILLADLIFSYSTKLPIKITNIYWSNFCSIMQFVASSIFFHFFKLNTYFLLQSFSYTTLGFFNFLPNWRYFFTRLNERLTINYEKSHSWDLEGSIFVGVLGESTSFVSFGPYVRKDLKNILANNNCGLTNIEEAIFTTRKLKEKFQIMDEQNKVNTYHILMRRKLLIDKQLSDLCDNLILRYFHCFYNFRKINALNIAKNDLNNCISSIEEEVYKLVESKSELNLNPYLKEKIENVKIDYAEYPFINAISRRISGVANLIGIKDLTAQDTKKFLLSSVSFVCAAAVEIFKLTATYAFSQSNTLSLFPSWGRSY